VTLSHYSALGDEVRVRPGTTLAHRVVVYPRLALPEGLQLTTPTVVRSEEQLVSRHRRRETPGTMPALSA